MIPWITNVIEPKNTLTRPPWKVDCLIPTPEQSYSLINLTSRRNSCELLAQTKYGRSKSTVPSVTWEPVNTAIWSRNFLWHYVAKTYGSRLMTRTGSQSTSTTFLWRVIEVRGLDYLPEVVFWVQRRILDSPLALEGPLETFFFKPSKVSKMSPKSRRNISRHSCFGNNVKHLGFLGHPCFRLKKSLCSQHNLMEGTTCSVWIECSSLLYLSL